MVDLEQGVSKDFEGEARIGRVVKDFLRLSLKPEDFSSPVALQMAISRLYEGMMRMMERGGPQPTYVAEVRFTDDMGNPVVIAVELGPETPPFSRDRVKARIRVELYED
nr:hypothetical protein [Aeropyrum camini]